MKKRITKLAVYALVLCFTLGLNSCDEEYWWGNYGNDSWVADNIIGTWRIVEVSPGSGAYPPYEPNDRMVFLPDGTMRSFGMDLDEVAYWDVYDRYVHFDFDGRDDMVAYVSQMDRDYMVLDVKEYDGYGTRYRLRLLYSGNYYASKK